MNRINPCLVMRILAAVCLVLTPAVDLKAQRTLGLDISAWQGNISQTTWNNIKNVENRSFVFFRSSRGGTTGFFNQSNPGNDNPPGQNTLSQRYDDTYFVQNMNRSTTAGLLAGSYHFSRPDIIESTLNSGGIANSGLDEANHYIQMAGAFMRPGYLYPVHDFEAGQGARTSNQMAQFCIDFSDRVHEVLGIRPAIYLNGNYANGVLGGASASLRLQVVTKHPILWIARWPNQANPDAINVQSGHPKDSLSTIYGIWDDYGVTHPWIFWQYASTGRLQSYNNGNSNLDFNVCQGDVEYLKDFMVPAIWLHDNSGSWTTLTNWNCGLAPIVPVTGPGQVTPFGTQTLPTPRLPGASGTGITSGQNDFVVIDRPNAQITVTHSSGAHTVRKLIVREQLDITGGSLTVNYDPDYTSDLVGFPAALRSGTVSARFSRPVSLSGDGSFSVHTLQVDPQASFSIGGGKWMFCRVNLLPDDRSPARIVLNGDLTVQPEWSHTMHIAACAGNGDAGFVDLGGEDRRISVAGLEDQTLLSISVPLVNGGLIKEGLGVLSLTGENSYQGDTQVRNGRLRLGRPSLHSQSRVLLSSEAELWLDFLDGPNAIESLWIDGVPQAAGTWGAVGSGADHTSPLISGPGWLRVMHGPPLDGPRLDGGQL
jgi:autotransporter-associated beta strand protein